MKAFAVSLAATLFMAAWTPSLAQSHDARTDRVDESTGTHASTFAHPRDEGVWYEIFVRSFQDSNGDGIGDLRGVIDRLPYLTELGIDGIWLMPIHPATSYHGYDVTDYVAIAPEYGTLADFDALVAAAHGAGIRLVLDFVPNHTSRHHPWFQAALSGDAAQRAKYVFRDDYVNWTGLGGPAWHAAGDAWYLGLFWSGMPDLDHRNPDVVDEFEEILRFWLDRGVDGFRIDAIQHIVESPDGQVTGTHETLAWVRDMQARTKAIAPDAFWMGETYARSAVTVARYHRDGDLDMSLDYPMWDAILTAISQRSALPLARALDAVTTLYPAGAQRVTFISNHDQIRPATTLGALRRDEARLKLAATLLLTLPGTPMLYYGEEIGLPNGPGDRDEEKRTPMQWSSSSPGRGFTSSTPWRRFASDDLTIDVETQQSDRSSIWWHYRDLIALRRQVPALRRGSFEVVDVEASSLLAFTRRDGDDEVLVLVNLGTAPVELSRRELPALPRTLLAGTATATEEGWTVPRLGFAVLGTDAAAAGPTSSR